MRELFSQRPIRYRLAGSLLVSHRFLKRMGAWPSGAGFRVLLFHDIPKQLTGTFEQFLQRVLSVHRVITPSEAEAFLSGNSSIATPTNEQLPVLLTFDDGFRSQAQVARAVLNQYGVKALFFVCPGLIDVPAAQQREAIARHIFDGQLKGDDLSPELAVMSWSDVEDLEVSGHTVGSHTTFHSRLCRLNSDELQDEVYGSADRLKKRLTVSTRWFAYPFGDIQSIDARSYEVISRCYQFCCSGIRGFNTAGAHPLALLRDHLEPDSPAAYQDFILGGGLDLYYRRRAGLLREMAQEAGTVRGSYSTT